MTNIVTSERTVDNMEPCIHVEHALHVLEIIEAARTSGSAGRKVNLQSTFTWPMV